MSAMEGNDVEKNEKINKLKHKRHLSLFIALLCVKKVTIYKLFLH